MKRAFNLPAIIVSDTEAPPSITRCNIVVLFVCNRRVPKLNGENERHNFPLSLHTDYFAEKLHVLNDLFSLIAQKEVIVFLVLRCVSMFVVARVGYIISQTLITHCCVNGRPKSYFFYHIYRM